MADDFSWAIVVSSLAGVLLGSIPSILSIYFGPKKQEEAKIQSEKELRIYNKKEELMNIALTNIDSFHVIDSTDDITNEDTRSKRVIFMDSYRHLWLYATDEEIRAINDFLAHSGYKRPDFSPGREEYQRMVLMMRRGMVPNTNLREDDFYIASVR